MYLLVFLVCHTGLPSRDGRIEMIIPSNASYSFVLSVVFSFFECIGKVSTPFLVLNISKDFIVTILSSSL